MAIRPGTTIIAELTLATRDTFEPVSGAQVELQQFDPAIGDFRPVSSGRTGPQGTVILSLALPTVPGRYRYRSSFQGTPDLQRDVSPEERIDIAV